MNEEEQQKLIDIWTIDLPNALNQNLQSKTEAIEKAIPILAQGHAELALAKLGVGNEDYGLYREIEENYSGIFKTIGGKILENAFEIVKKDNPNINAKDWFSTQNLEQIFSDERFNDEKGKKGFLDLSIFDYEEIAKIWDDMGAYDPNELRKALSALDLDSDITDLIVPYLLLLYLFLWALYLLDLLIFLLNLLLLFFLIHLFLLLEHMHLVLS